MLSKKYSAVHAYVRRRKTKPKWCTNCRRQPPRDLANISGNYLHVLSDWQYLCRKCHMDSDGRNDQLRTSGKSRKLPNQVCAGCKTIFHRDKLGKFCGLKCRDKARVGITRPFYGNQFTLLKTKKRT